MPLYGCYKKTHVFVAAAQSLDKKDISKAG